MRPSVALGPCFQGVWVQSVEGKPVCSEECALAFSSPAPPTGTDWSSLRETGREHGHALSESQPRRLSTLPAGARPSLRDSRAPAPGGRQVGFSRAQRRGSGWSEREAES